MFVNTKKLSEKIKEKKLTHVNFAEKIGMDPSTYYRKLKSEGRSFTVGEMHTIADALELTKEEAVQIFLS